jgi:hypothetical protein
MSLQALKDHLAEAGRSTALKQLATAPPEPVAAAPGDEAHHHHPAAPAGHPSVLTDHFRGHELRITVSYQFAIDDRVIPLHVSVSDDGRICCHTFPYATFTSPVDLFRHFVQTHPEAVEPSGGHHDGHDGAANGESTSTPGLHPEGHS